MNYFKKKKKKERYTKSGQELERWNGIILQKHLKQIWVAFPSTAVVVDGLWWPLDLPPIRRDTRSSDQCLLILLNSQFLLLADSCLLGGGSRWWWFLLLSSPPPFFSSLCPSTALEDRLIRRWIFYLRSMKLKLLLSFLMIQTRLLRFFEV